MKTYDLVVLGEVAIDVVLAGVEEIPKSWSVLGRTKAAGIFTAGSAGYVAQCYSKLGGRAAIVGRMGNDDAGRMALEGFRQSNVSTRYLIIDRSVRTEVSTVVLYNNGNKASIVSKIPPLGLRSIDLSLLENTKAFHIGGYLLFPDIWGRSIRRLLRKATREEVIVSLDPQMSASSQWSIAFHGILEHLNILLLDEMEAIRISKKRRIANAIEYLEKSGVETIAVKAGRRGCIVSSHDKLFRVKALRSKVISTIGAGDAFDAAFIYGVLRNWPVEKIACFANVVASISTTQLGCMTALPRATRLQRLVRQSNTQVRRRIEV